MPVITGVSSSLRRPQTFHVFTYLLGGRALVPLVQKVALVGMAYGSNFVAGTVYNVYDASQTDNLFGVGSELALMCRKAFETAAQIGQGPQISAVPIAEPGAGTANVKTLTVVGPATADGNIIIRIAGRTFTIGVANGDPQNTIATAISNVLKANLAVLPVSVSVATNVVTLTHRNKGENGGDVVLSVDQTVAGVTVTPANSVAGAGVATIVTATDALAPLEYDAIAFANRKAADITVINADLAARWSASEKRWRWYFVADSTSIASGTALATAANHTAVVVASFEGSPSLPGEIATAVAVGALSRDRPNANYDGMRLPVYPPAASIVYTGAEVETAINAGMTPLTAIVDPATKSVVDGVGKIERMITTKTTEGGNPFEPLRDFAVARTGVYLARQIDIGYTSRFGASANPDGVLLSSDTVALVRDMVANILYAAQDRNIVENVDTDLKQLVVEKDSVAVGRLNVDVTYHPVLGLHQVAFVHRVTI